jgi:hypothetical protein
MGDLEDLFASVDSFKEDLMDFGVAGIGLIGANLVWGYIDEGLIAKIPVIGDSVWARALVAIVAGVAGGAALARTNKNLATGVAVGLTARGLTTLLRQVAPSLPLQGLGMTANERYLLSPGVGYATTEVEAVNGASLQIENVAGFNGLASTLQ